MFRNSISTTVSGSVVRKASSVGLLVAGAVGTSPWLRASGPCTDGAYAACQIQCDVNDQDVNFCWVGNSGTVWCDCT
jgi:hypothetical protein